MRKVQNNVIVNDSEMVMQRRDTLEDYNKSVTYELLLGLVKELHASGLVEIESHKLCSDDVVSSDATKYTAQVFVMNNEDIKNVTQFLLKIRSLLQKLIIASNYTDPRVIDLESELNQLLDAFRLG